MKKIEISTPLLLLLSLTLLQLIFAVEFLVVKNGNPPEMNWEIFDFSSHKLMKIDVLKIGIELLKIIEKLHSFDIIH